MRQMRVMWWTLGASRLAVVIINAPRVSDGQQIRCMFTARTQMHGLARLKDNRTMRVCVRVYAHVYAVCSVRAELCALYCWHHELDALTHRTRVV